MSELDSTPLGSVDRTPDDLFDILSNQHRRYVLSYLRDADDDVSELAELADWVTTQEPGYTGDQREAVAIGLHHTHLPKLADYGPFDYDARRTTIRYHGGPELDRMVALIDEPEGDHT
ncbi:hypothetical protein DMJ13_11285 [halophilic archaeon]|nr:hypothetical protein DMJ13_11285 [halophilic archaeon]